MALNTDWKEFLELLVSCDVEFLIVGAWARAFYGEPCMTGDIDFWIRPTAENSTRVRTAIERFGFAWLGLNDDDFQQHDQVVQLGLPPRRIDILTSLTALDFDTSWRRSSPAVLDGIPVRYLSSEDFITNKLAVGRAKDLADVEAIRHDGPIS